LWTNTSNEVLGRKKKQNKAWISNHTISKINQKRKKKQNLSKARTGWQKDGKSAKKQTGMSQDNRKFLDNLAEEKDTAASQHNKPNKKKLYDTTRNMSIRFKATRYQFRDLNGCLISCRRDTERIIPTEGYSWRPIERLAKGRGDNRSFCQWPVLRNA